MSIESEPTLHSITEERYYGEIGERIRAGFLDPKGCYTFRHRRNGRKIFAVDRFIQLIEFTEEGTRHLGRISFRLSGENQSRPDLVTTIEPSGMIYLRNDNSSSADEIGYFLDARGELEHELEKLQDEVLVPIRWSSCPEEVTKALTLPE